jgi:DNA-binding PadR family transcriptional regulator
MRNTRSFLPLKAVHHLILLLLAEAPDSGVELLDRLEGASRGTVRLNPGSLYRTIARLVDDGLVEAAGTEPGPGGTGAPRKVYRVTVLGRSVLRAEAERQAELVEFAGRLRLSGDPR